MAQFDRLKEAKKLREGRFFGGFELKRTLPMGDLLEKKLAQIYSTLPEFQNAVIKILDALEKQTFEDEADLEAAYYNELSKYAKFGPFYDMTKGIIFD